MRHYIEPAADLLRQLKDILSYDAATGLFTWLQPGRNRVPIGSIAGSPDARGYILITIRGRHYKAHRLAWWFVTGTWPTLDIDHADGQSANNCFSNLRLATPSDNLQNARKPRDNRSGVKGVYWNATKKRWQAQLYIGGRQTYLGRFESKDEAETVVRARRATEHGEFARHE